MTTKTKTSALGDAAPWITLVHGMSQDHRIFDRQVDAFRDRFNLLFVDLPGHGLAADIGGPFGHLEFMRHLEEAIGKNDIRRTHYWGTHTGATVGLLLAAARPELIQSLVLEGPVVPGQNPPVVNQLMSAAKAELLENGVEAARSVWWSQSCWFEHMRSHALECRADEHRAIVDSFGGAPWSSTRTPEPVHDVEGKLRSISQPALIYNGAEDHAEFLAAAKTIASMVPHAEPAMIANAGGFPAWEQPDAVNAVVSDFLSRF